MRIIKTSAVLFAVSISASCVVAAPHDSLAVSAGMPSDTEWNVMLMTSAPAYTIARSSGGGMPTEAVWNAVLEEDRKEMQQGFASASQLKVDMELGQLLREARSAIASKDAVKMHELGAKLQADLDQRMKIVRGIADDYSQRHPFKLMPSGNGPACMNPSDPMACARQAAPRGGGGVHICGGSEAGSGAQVGTGPSGEPLCN